MKVASSPAQTARRGRARLAPRHAHERRHIDRRLPDAGHAARRARGQDEEQ